MRQVRHEVAQLVGEAKERSDLCEVGWPGKGSDCCHLLWVGLHALVADDVACEFDLGADGKLFAGQANVVASAQVQDFAEPLLELFHALCASQTIINNFLGARLILESSVGGLAESISSGA